MPTLVSGDTLDNYQLIREIGRGGFGVVWLAKPKIGKNVALKIVPKGDRGDRELAALRDYIKFHQENRTPPPGLMAVDYVGEREDCIYYVMPLADSMHDGVDASEASYAPKSLGRLIDSQRQLSHWFGGKQIGEWLAAMCDGVQALSDGSLSHGDIKPDNILFVNGRPVMGDISLLQTRSRNKPSGGTRGFTAPPLVIKLDGNPDLYALGATLFATLSGQSPELFMRADSHWPPKGKNSLELPDRKMWNELRNIVLNACDPSEENISAYEEPRQMAEALRRAVGLPRERKYIAIQIYSDFLPSERIPQFKKIIKDRTQDIKKDYIVQIRESSLEFIEQGNLKEEQSLHIIYITANALKDGGLSKANIEAMGQLGKVVANDGGVGRVLLLIEKGENGPSISEALVTPDSLLEKYCEVEAFEGAGAFEKILTCSLNNWLNRITYKPRLINGSLESANPFVNFALSGPTSVFHYFGREREVVETINLLRRGSERKVWVQGKAGCGKTSFINAGVIPALPRFTESGVDIEWVQVNLSLTFQKTPLLDLLKAALIKSIPELGDRLGGAEIFRRDVTSFKELRLCLFPYINDRNAQNGSAKITKIIVVIDQLERAPTLHPELIEITNIFSDFNDIWQVIVSRSAVAGASFQLESWPRIELNEFGEVALSEILAKQAQSAGVEFEGKPQPLNQRIAADFVDSKLSLPFLQVIMHELWKRSEFDGARHRITLRSYISIRGVNGPIADYVSKTEEALKVPDQLAGISHLFMCVVDAGNSTGNFKGRSIALDVLRENNELWSIACILIENRILVDDGVSVTIASDQFLQDWPRLSTWTREKQDSLSIRADLESRANSWTHDSNLGPEEGKESDTLRGRWLKRAKDLYKRFPLALDKRLVEYIQYSEEQEKERIRRIRRTVSLGLIAISLTALLFRNDHAYWDNLVKKVTEELATYVQENKELRNHIHKLVDENDQLTKSLNGKIAEYISERDLRITAEDVAASERNLKEEALGKLNASEQLVVEQVNTITRYNADLSMKINELKLAESEHKKTKAELADAKDHVEALNIVVLDQEAKDKVLTTKYNEGISRIEQLSQEKLKLEQERDSLAERLRQAQQAISIPPVTSEFSGDKSSFQIQVITTEPHPDLTSPPNK